MTEDKGDQAFRKAALKGRWREMTYGGALSFLRRAYSRDVAAADITVMGVPFDSAVTNRPGTRLGPNAIRAASTQLAELKAFPWGFDPFETLAVIDYGDVFLDPHHPETVAQAIETAASGIINAGSRLVTLGGDHSISYPLLRAHNAAYGQVALVHFDAHGDLWDDRDRPMDHGTMFARAATEGIISPAHSTQIGIRTIAGVDYGFEILTAPWVHKNGIEAAIKIAVERAGDMPVYLSFDVDGLDPAFAPGTGTPVPGGLASWQALELVRGLAPLNLIGMDVVEVSPPFDHAEITANIAAHVAHDWICVIAAQMGAIGDAEGCV